MAAPPDLSGQYGQPSQLRAAPLPQPHILASVFTPFNLAPAEASFPTERDEKLRTIIANLEKHHDNVRRNMLFLTKCKAERLMSDAKAEIEHLQAGDQHPGGTGKLQDVSAADEQAQKKSSEELKAALRNMVKSMNIRPRQRSNSNSTSSVMSPASSSTLPPAQTLSQSQGGVTQSPLATTAILDTVMSGTGSDNNSITRSTSYLTASPTTMSPISPYQDHAALPPATASQPRSTYTILRDLDSAVRRLIDQTSAEMEVYDIHAKAVVDSYRRALERGNNARQGSSAETR